MCPLGHSEFCTAPGSSAFQTVQTEYFPRPSTLVSLQGLFFSGRFQYFTISFFVIKRGELLPISTNLGSCKNNFLWIICDSPFLCIPYTSFACGAASKLTVKYLGSPVTWFSSHGSLAQATNSGRPSAVNALGLPDAHTPGAMEEATDSWVSKPPPFLSAFIFWSRGALGLWGVWWRWEDVPRELARRAWSTGHRKRRQRVWGQHFQLHWLLCI